VLAAVALVFNSCKKEESLSFEYHGEKIIMTLRPKANQPLSYDTTGVVYFNADSMAKANKFPTEALNEVTMSDIEFTLLNPLTEVDFDMIKTMNASVYAANPTDAVSLFQNQNIKSKTKDKIIVSGLSQNLKEVVFNNKNFYIDLSGELTDTLTKPIKIEAYFTYKVSLQGIKIK
jgi:hypothetical protein